MKQSWSTTLFFKINKRLGQKPGLDIAMRFFAEWYIWLMGIAVFLWALRTVEATAFWQGVTLLGIVGLIGFVLSWGIGILFPHKRPIREHATVRQIIRPLGTWKSFPSDHTIAGFSLAGVATIAGAPVWFAVLLFFSAALVSTARVYVGVHYPRDIVGGMIVAAIAVWLGNLVTMFLFV